MLATGHAVTRARELRRRMRRARRVHADRTIWRQLEDAYVWVFAVVVVGAMAVNGARELRLQPSLCSTYRCTVVLDRLPLVFLLLLMATAVRVLLAVGPVVASRATGFWLLATPVDRAALLRPAYLMVLVCAPVVAIATGLLGTAVPDLWSMAAVLTGSAVTALLLIGLAGVAVVVQRSERGTKWMLRAADAVLVLVVVLVWRITSHVAGLGPPQSQGAIIVIRPYYRDESAVDPADVALGATAVLAVLVTAALAVAGGRALGRLPLTRLIAGGDLMAGLAGAAASLDVGLLADIVAGRRWRQVSVVRRWPGWSAGPLAIVQREACRVLRWPRRLVVGAALLVIPYAVSTVGEPKLVLVSAALAGLFAIRPLTDGLRTVSRSPGLARTLPLSPRALRIVYAVVPGTFASLWSLAATPALIDLPEPGAGPVDDAVLAGLAGSVVVAAAILAGVVRHASAPRPSYDGPLLATPMGAVPPGLMSQPLRGLDVLVVALLAALFGLPSAVAVAAAVVVAALVLAVRTADT